MNTDKRCLSKIWKSTKTSLSSLVYGSMSRAQHAHWPNMRVGWAVTPSLCFACNKSLGHITEFNISCLDSNPAPRTPHLARQSFASFMSLAGKKSIPAWIISRCLKLPFKTELKCGLSGALPHWLVTERSFSLRPVCVDSN